MHKLFALTSRSVKRVYKATFAVQKGSLLLLMFALAVMIGQNYPTLAQTTGAAASSTSFINTSTIVQMLLGSDNPELLKALYGTECVNPSLLSEFNVAAQTLLSASPSDPETGFKGTAPDYCILNESDLPLEEQVSLIYGKPGSTGGLNYIISRVESTILDQEPMSALAFANDQVNRFVNAGAVYAQEAAPGYFPGSGDDMLRPIQGLWGWAVTAAYSALVLVIIVVGIGLALRDRLPGEQNITLNNSIRGIVLAMILIPLSYPIAGLFIDLTTVGTNAIHGFLFRDGGVAESVLEGYRDGGDSSGRDLYADDPNINFFNIRNRIGIDEVFRVSREGIISSLECDISRDAEGKCGDEAGGLFGVATGLLKFITDPDGNVVGWLITSIIFTLLNVALLLTGLRIGWFLLKRFVLTLFAPIIMPFSFLTLALPGNISKDAFNTIKQLAATSLCFMAAYGMVLAAVMFSSTSFFATNLPATESGSSYQYTPPLFGGLQSILVGTTNVVGAGGSAGASSPAISLILAVVGIAIYFGIPSTLESLYKKIAPETQLPFKDFAKSSFGELSTSFRLGARGGRRVVGLGYQTAVSPLATRAGKNARAYMNEEDDTGKTRFQRRIGDPLQKFVDSANTNAAASSGVGRAFYGGLARAGAAVGNTAGKGLTGKEDATVTNSRTTDVGKADLELSLSTTSSGVYIEDKTILVTEAAVIDGFSATPVGDSYRIIPSPSTYGISLRLSFKSVKEKDKPLAAGKLSFSEEPDTVVGVFSGGDGGSTNKIGALTVTTAKQNYNLDSSGSVSIPISINLDYRYAVAKYNLANRDLPMSKAIKVTVKNVNGTKLEKTFNLNLKVATNSKFIE